MKIVEVRVHHLAGELRERFGWSLNWTRTRAATLVEVRTDDGITGWGDGAWGGERLRRHPELVIGRSVLEAEAIYDDLRPAAAAQHDRGEPSSAGLDAAIWDAMGHTLGLPLAKLLGHQRTSAVTPYCTCMYRKDWPDLARGLAEEAVQWLSRGFRVLKMKIGYGPKTDVEVVRAVREAIGDRAGLAVDSNCAYDAGTAVALGRQLEPFGLLWWEEPLWADDLSGYDRLRASIGIPLASGETMSADWIIRHYIQPRRVDIVQPDLDTVGFTGARRIAHMCELNGVRLIPHNWGTHVRTAGALHWMSRFSAPDAPMFEFDQTEHPFRERVVREKMEMNAAGAIPVPDGPGLGIEADPDAVAEFRKELLIIER